MNKSDNINSVFLKCEDSDDIKITENNGISKKNILGSIPKNALLKPNNDLQLTHTEWRWRIFEIPTKKNQLIEISYKKPTENRMYTNKSGDWVESTVDEKFDEFVIMEFYAYSD